MAARCCPESLCADTTGLTISRIVVKQVEMAGRATCTPRASSRGSRLVHTLTLAFVYTRETRADADTAEVLTMDEAGARGEPAHSD